MGIRIDANGEHVTHATPTVQTEGDWTICFFATARGDAGVQPQIVGFVGESASVGSTLSIDDTTEDLFAGHSGGGANRGALLTDFSATANRGRWAFMAMQREDTGGSYDEAHWKARWLDETTLASASWTNGFFQGDDTNFWLGRSNDFATERSDISVACVKMWNAVLTDEELLLESQYWLPQTNLDSLVTFVPLRDTSDVEELFSGGIGPLTVVGASDDTDNPPVPWGPQSTYLIAPAASTGAVALEGSLESASALEGILSMDMVLSGSAPSASDLSGALSVTGDVDLAGSLPSASGATADLVLGTDWDTIIADMDIAFLVTDLAGGATLTTGQNNQPNQGSAGSGDNDYNFEVENVVDRLTDHFGSGLDGAEMPGGASAGFKSDTPTAGFFDFSAGFTMAVILEFDAWTTAGMVMNFEDDTGVRHAIYKDGTDAIGMRKTSTPEYGSGSYAANEPLLIIAYFDRTNGANNWLTVNNLDNTPASNVGVATGTGQIPGLPDLTTETDGFTWLAAGWMEGEMSTATQDAWWGLAQDAGVGAVPSAAPGNLRHAGPRKTFRLKWR